MAKRVDGIPGPKKLIVAEGEADESAVVTDDLFHLGGPRVVRGRLADGALAFQAVNPADGASFHFDVGHVAVFPEGKSNDDAAYIADVRYDFVPAILNGGDEACIVFAVWRGLGVESLDARLAANTWGTWGAIDPTRTPGSVP